MPAPAAPPPAPPGYASPPPPPGYTPPPPPGYAPPAYGQPAPAYGQAPPPPPPPGYGAPTYGAPGYGQPAYGYEAPRTEGQAVAALVVSIVGLFVCGVISGVIALVLANQAQQKIVASGGRLTGEGMVKAARIIAVVSIVLSVLGFALLISSS